MTGDQTSKTGKWIDTDTGKVVDTEPMHGRLLVVPGGVVTPDIEAAIEAAARLEAAETAVAPGAEVSTPATAADAGAISAPGRAKRR